MAQTASNTIDAPAGQQSVDDGSDVLDGTALQSQPEAEDGSVGRGVTSGIASAAAPYRQLSGASFIESSYAAKLIEPPATAEGLRGPSIQEPLLTPGSSAGVVTSGESGPVTSRSGVQSAAVDKPSNKVARGMAAGSSNPHVLFTAADRAPVSKRRAAFDPIAHRAASDAELARRPLPACNRAPTTAPLPPPPLPPPNHPRVTRVDQVVSRKALWLIAIWKRRLRRCLRFAELGQFSMARRLRPDDLWLDHDVYSVTDTAAWDWDLRPLASGGDAVPWHPSGVGGVSPSSDLSCGLLQRPLTRVMSAFEDQAIVSEMLQGIRDDAECERGTLLCAPHNGALKLYAQGRDKLLKNERRGWATGGWELPCWPLRASPYSVVDESGRSGEPKFRLTNDLSWPHAGMLNDGSGGHVVSVNASMKRSLWPKNSLPRAAQTGEAAAILRSSGAPVKLWGLDGEAYYRAFGRQRSEMWRNALAMAEGFQVDERSCFGSAADATKCSRGSNLVAWLVKHAIADFDGLHPTRDPLVISWLQSRREEAVAAGCTSAEADELYTALVAFSVYIDDGTGASINDLLFDVDGNPVMRDGVQLRRAQRHFELAIAALEELGVKSSALKEQPPDDRVESLGLDIDLVKDKMCVLDYKRTKYAEKAREVASLRCVDRAELVSLLSKLLFAASCYPAGRPWTNAAWRCARAEFAISDDRVVLSRHAREGILRWACALEGEMEHGVPLAHGAFPSFGSAFCNAIYADASGNQGWSAWCLVGDTVHMCAGPWTPDEIDDPSFIIAEKELLASTLGLVTLAPIGGMKFVYQFTDNTNAEGAMRRLSPKTRRMQLMIERRSEWMLENGVMESAERITSESNLWADLGSRDAVLEVERQAHSLGYKFNLVVSPEDWRETSTWRRDLETAAHSPATSMQA